MSDLCRSSGLGLNLSMMESMAAVMAPLPGGGEVIRVSPFFSSYYKVENKRVKIYVQRLKTTKPTIRVL